jgi:hypothetical protein
MTLDAVRTQARRYAGMDDTTLLTNAQLNTLIGDAVTKFSNDVGGFAMDVLPEIAATFDTGTNYAIRVTIVGGANAMVATDVLITGTARDDTTGTIVASDFETTLQAAVGSSITVAWAAFAFTVDTLDATSITYEAPTTVTYVDARELLGLTGTPTLTDFSHTGAFPQDCTVRYTLPTDLIAVERVEWDSNELVAVPRAHAQSPESSGTPHWYNIRGRTLHFIPSPSTQKLCEVWYRGVPADIVFSGYQEVGLSGKADNTLSGLSATTQYYYKIAINGAAVTEYDITTATDVTLSAVIALMNTENSGATWSIVGGDLRCTSDGMTGISSIALSAGTTGTNLFATLTGWSAFDTAVAGDTDAPDEIPANYHEALAFFASYLALLEQRDDKLAGLRRAEYRQVMLSFRLERHLRDTEINRRDGSIRGLRYTVTI